MNGLTPEELATLERQRAYEKSRAEHREWEARQRVKNATEVAALVKGLPRVSTGDLLAELARRIDAKEDAE